jgi:hypothetical protein
LVEFRGSDTKDFIVPLVNNLPDNSNLNGVFCYISKDDCTIIQAPIKFNQNIIDETIVPVLDLINDAYEKKDPTLIPIPDPVTYSDSRGQFQKNWIATYCDYHKQCAGVGWLLEANNLVTRKNNENREKVSFAHTVKKVKPQIEVVS